MMICSAQEKYLAFPGKPASQFDKHPHHTPLELHFITVSSYFTAGRGEGAKQEAG